MSANAFDVAAGPEHVLLVAEIVSPGSETTGRIVKLDQYARAGIYQCERSGAVTWARGRPVRADTTAAASASS
jgi:hypothetical protein